MEINIYQVLFQAFNFGVILFVLTKFLYKPIRKVLDDRELKINAGLTAAEKNLKAQAEIETLKKSELSKARRDAAKLIKDAELTAKKQGEVILKDAKDKASKEAARLLDAAESSAKNVRKEMQTSLKALVIETTAKLLGQALSAKDIERINKVVASSLK